MLLGRGETGKTCAKLCSGQKIHAMQRTISILLLVITGLTPVLWLDATAQASTTACCRRTGKHHCQEQVAEISHNGPVLSSTRMKCPMFPARLMVSGYSTQLLPAASQNFYAAIVSHPAIYTQVESSYRICWSRSQQKRGPPVAIS